MGLAYKRLIDADGTELGRWRYIQGPRPDHEPAEPQFSQEIRTWVTDPEGNQSVHYFHDAEEEYQDPTRVTDWRHGRPFTMNITDGSLHLSNRIYESDATLAHLRRSTWVRYTADQLATSSWGNHRLVSTRTVFHDDSDTYAQTDYSAFDGLGHFRRAVTSGSFASGNVRETFTEFNPSAGIYDYDRHSFAPGPEGIDTFVLPAVSAPWVLGTFSETTETENGLSQKREHCFTASGFLERQRLLKEIAASPAAGAEDVITVFDDNDGDGLVDRERTYGGDGAALPAGALCGIDLSGVTPDYEIAHTHTYGAVATSRYLKADGSDMEFLSVDRDIDPRTSLVSLSRDTAGLATSFQYDSLGRMTRATLPSGAYQEIVFNAPTAEGYTVVDSRFWSPSTLQAKSVATFDAFGRPYLEGIRFPDGVQQLRYFEHNANAWRTSVSELGKANKKTVFSDFDAFGRPRTVTLPDSSIMTRAYAGVRETTRTISIWDGTAEHSSSTTEVYDRQGRLISVTEPSDNGADFTTTYAYDVGGRLSDVTMGVQARSFIFDGRGFLLAETHPEKGTAGNGTVTYADYDARGHAGTITEDKALVYTHDRAERLATIKRTSGALLKKFEYSVRADNSKGKLLRATRVNRADFDGTGNPFEVVEEYRYDGWDGRVSRRDTWIETAGAIVQRFRQEWAYDKLGDVESITYPCLAQGATSFSEATQLSDPGDPDLLTNFSCVAAGDPAPIRSQSFQYSSGFLTAVPGWATSITYHNNGMLDRVDFASGDAYYQGQDPDWMARPASIGSLVNGATVELDYSYDSSGNVKALAGSESYAYDPVGRLTEIVFEAGAEQEYDYDTYGNITEIRTYQGTPPSWETRSLPTTASSNHLTGATYDGRGNLTSYGDQTYSFDLFNNLTTLQGGGNDERYLYTADDERLAVRQFEGETHETRWFLRGLGAEVLREYRERSGPAPDTVFEDGFETGDLCAWSLDDGTPPSCFGLFWVRDYIYRGSQLLGSDSPQTADPKSGPLYYHLDHLGTPRLITNDAQERVGGEALFAFGEEKAATSQGDIVVPKRFTGHERDTHQEIGSGEDLDYMHARYFHSRLTRFLSTDPVAGAPDKPLTWNQYSYVANNPIVRTDPFGLFPCGDNGEFECQDSVTVIAELGPRISEGELARLYLEYWYSKLQEQLGDLRSFFEAEQTDPATGIIASSTDQTILFLLPEEDTLALDVALVVLMVPESKSLSLLKRAKRLHISVESDLARNLDTPVMKFINEFRQGKIIREFPTELLEPEITVEKALVDGGPKVKKLLGDSRFAK